MTKILCSTILEVVEMNEIFNMWNDDSLLKKLNFLGSGIIIHIENNKFSGFNFKDGVWYNGELLMPENDYITYKEFKNGI